MLVSMYTGESMVTMYCTLELTTTGKSVLQFEGTSDERRTPGEVIACIAFQGGLFKSMKLVHNVSLDL